MAEFYKPFDPDEKPLHEMILEALEADGRIRVDYADTDWRTGPDIFRDTHIKVAWKTPPKATLWERLTGNYPCEVDASSWILADYFRERPSDDRSLDLEHGPYVIKLTLLSFEYRQTVYAGPTVFRFGDAVFESPYINLVDRVTIAPY